MGIFSKRDKGSNCGSSNGLAQARKLLKKADDLAREGKWIEMKRSCDTIITISESVLQDRSDRLESVRILGKAYLKRAYAALELREYEASEEFDKKAIELFENLVNREGADELLSDLAKTYSDVAGNWYRCNGYKQSARLYGQAIETYERMRNVRTDLEVDGDLAHAHFNLAGSLGYYGEGCDFEGALLEYDKAIELYEYLVEEKGIHKLARSWGGAYYAKHKIAKTQGDQEKAAEYLGMLLEIYTRFDLE